MKAVSGKGVSRSRFQPGPHVVDQTGFLGNGDELFGDDDLAVLLPADQGLELGRLFAA